MTLLKASVLHAKTQSYGNDIFQLTQNSFTGALVCTVIFLNNARQFNSLVLSLYPVLYTNRFSGLLCIILFLVYGLV